MGEGNFQKFIAALTNTAAIILIIFIACIILAITVGPFILIVAFDGSTWAGILTAVWGFVFFIFVLAFLHEHLE